MTSITYTLSHILDFKLILALVVFFIVRDLYATAMRKAAEAKGHGREAHVWAMCFWLGALGGIYVVALPDLVHQRQNQRIIELLAEKQNNNTL